MQLAMGEYNTAETENVGINKLTEADIADIENKFAEAADRAVKAGYHNSASLLSEILTFPQHFRNNSETLWKYNTDKSGNTEVLNMKNIILSARLLAENLFVSIARLFGAAKGNYFTVYSDDIIGIG